MFSPSLSDTHDSPPPAQPAVSGQTLAPTQSPFALSTRSNVAAARVQMRHKQAHIHVQALTGIKQSYQTIILNILGANAVCGFFFYFMIAFYPALGVKCVEMHTFCIPYADLQLTLI